MAISRAQMCTNRLQNSIRHQRKEIAAFLKEGREEGARLKGEHLLREYRLERAMEILVTSYLATEKTCPLDLLSPIHTLLYCEPRLSIDELTTVRRQLGMKYGEAFVDSALKNAKQEVHFKLVHALSLAPPLEFDLQQLLCGIAKEYLISNWKPSIALEERQACDFIPRPSLASRQIGGVPLRVFANCPEGPAAIRNREGAQRTGRWYTRIYMCKAEERNAKNYDKWLLTVCSKSEHFAVCGECSSDAPAVEGIPLGTSKDRVLATSRDQPFTLHRQYSDSWSREDCDTPLHQEIAFSGWPSPGSEVFPITPDKVQPRSQQRRGCRISEEAGQTTNGSAMVSRGEEMPVSALCAREEFMRHSGTCSPPIPTAAIPAYFLA
ncbi:uncharacterized protein LOC34619193 [Cyclospora cayetanensis]|uniref:Uncharacterized protein LOC34619193 n=1 Tax=Cyclospora cayetanensis TaxID=88456 RepID=A0A6P6RVI6_9EIME|nr:uncharacterized protein LOC34619193 [Cyclospora cayetanensis]